MREKAPKYRDLEKGIVNCPGCGVDIPLDTGEPMEIGNCPKCKEQVFFPYKVKNYWLYKPLGGGGMGSVYKAVGEDENHYAVKILPRKQKTNKLLIDNLLREGKAGKDIGKDKHVISIVDVGQAGDEYFMASEFIEGERLDVLIRESGHIPEKQVVEIGLQILEGEKHICAQGYLFRDLKPENVMVEPNGNVRIFDYGLTIPMEVAASTEELSDEIEGSPFYIPPERIIGTPEGVFSEIYSMGMLMFYMLTGRTYYSETEVKALMIKHVKSMRIASVRSHIKSCDDETIRIIDKMISRSPEARYPDFDSLKEELLNLQKILQEKAKKSDKKDKLVLPPGYKPAGTKKTYNIKRSKLPKIIGFTFLFLVVLAIAGIVLYNIYGPQIREYWIRKKAILEVAHSLKVSINVPEPDIKPEEAEKLIDEAADKKMEEAKTKLPEFDAVAAEKQIAEEMNLKDVKPPTKSVAEINKQINSEINKSIRTAYKKLPKFNTKQQQERLARRLKIKLPLEKPEKTKEEVEKELAKYAMKLAGEKYPKKMLIDAILKIQKDNRGYRVGDKITIFDAANRRITGTYKGIIGGKVTVEKRQVPLIDIPESERWKYSPTECSTRIQATTKKAKASFKKYKKDFAIKLFNEKLPAAMKKFGYRKVGKKWMTEQQVFNREFSKVRRNFNKNLNKRKAAIREAETKKINPDKYFISDGYQKVGGKWLPVASAVKEKVAEKHKEFEQEQQEQLQQIRAEARKELIPEIYRKHNYIFYDRKWRPAKKVFDELVEKQIKAELEGKKKPEINIAKPQKPEPGAPKDEKTNTKSDSKPADRKKAKPAKK